jgi:hypothetical protein
MFPMHYTGPHEFSIGTTLYSFAQKSTFVTYTARPKEKGYIFFSFPNIHSVGVFFGGDGQKSLITNYPQKIKFKSLWTPIP